MTDLKIFSLQLISELLDYLFFKFKKLRKLYILRNEISGELIINKYLANYKNIIIPFKNSLPLIKYEKNPILEAGETGEWDERGIREPFLFYDGKKYFIFYESRTNGKKMDFQIGVAIADKITGPWRKLINNPILKYTNNEGDFDKQCIADPSIIYHNEKYHMWFDMYDGKTWRIGKAYSNDGINWEKLKKNGRTEIILDIGKRNQWDNKIIHCPEVYLWNNRYHMLYGGIGTGHFNYDTGLAIQIDRKGEKFRKWAQITTDEMILKKSITTRLQAGIIINGILISGLRIRRSKGNETTYMMFSDDGGKSWYKLSNPLLKAGKNDEWDSKLFYGPNTWLISENKLWTAYLGGKKYKKRSLGLAYMKIPNIL